MTLFDAACLHKKKNISFSWGRGRKYRRGIHYNEEIPFEKFAPPGNFFSFFVVPLVSFILQLFPGFHDPSEDKIEEQKINFRNLRRQDLDGPRRDAIEAVIFFSFCPFPYIFRLIFRFVVFLG